jgi:hypothetical protein
MQRIALVVLFARILVALVSSKGAKRHLPESGYAQHKA